MNRPIHPADIPVMLTITEAHELYGLSKQFLYSVAKCGNVRAVKAGRKFLISAESLNDYLRNGSVCETKPATGGIRSLA